MRMAPDQFSRNSLQHVVNVEITAFCRNLGMQHDLEQQVTQLFSQVVHILTVKRIQSLVSLFQQERAQAQMGLLPIPGAAIRRSQPGDHLLKGFKGCLLRKGRYK